MELTSLPRPIPIAVYDAARAALIEKHVVIPGVLALLEFGTIPLPGISDIDFFIVVEPERQITLPRFREYPDDQQFAMNSLQCVITPETYRYLTHYDPWFVEVKTRFDATGECAHFQKQTFPTPAYAALSLHFLFEKFVYGCLPCIADVRSTGMIQVRRFFEEAKQTKYFLRECDKVGVAHAPDPEVGAADSVAREWFTMPESDQKPRILAAYDAFERSMMSLASALHTFLPTASTLRPIQLAPKTYTQREWLRRYPQSLVVHTPGRVFVYQQGRTDITLDTEIVTLPTVAPFQITTIVMPLSFAALATQHLFSMGGLSDYYRSSSCTDLPAVPFYADDQLMFLHALQNKNLLATRNVRNCKLYEMRFGYRPRPDHLSLGSRMSRFHQSLTSTLLHSPLYPRCVQRARRSVFTARV